MNIQTNLYSIGLLPSPKKGTTGPADVDYEEPRQQQTKDVSANDESTSSAAERATLFEQIESIDDNQKTSSRAEEPDYQNQRSIQSYLDNQALENQSLRDELHEQLGIDLTV